MNVFSMTRVKCSNSSDKAPIAWILIPVFVSLMSILSLRSKALTYLLHSFLSYSHLCSPIDYWVICHDFLSPADLFSKSNYLKKYFGNTIHVSKSLDPEQARRFVGPDLVPNVCKVIITRHQ